MKQLLILLLLTGLFVARSSAQVSFNTDGSAPNTSAMLDIKAADKGLLIPRVALIGTSDTTTIPSPATSLLIYNTATAGASPDNVTPGYYFWKVSAWVRLSVNAAGSGTINYLPKWDSSGMLGNSLLFDDGSNVGIGTTSPAKKLEISGEMQATGTGNNYFAGKVGIGTSSPAASAAMEISSTSLGLLPPRMTIAQRDAIASPAAGLIIWCTDCGTSGELQIHNGSAWTNMTGTASGCGVLTINHNTTSGVAPVNKTVTYGTVTNVPGEPSKCWITSNLGADRQATAVTDATEPSAGWYWQFNRKQGYKHDGTTRTPNTTWITSIDENNNWQAVNDPCTIELGTGWRIPTATEWTNADGASGGNWVNWNGPWNSALKMHAAGHLWTDGVFSERGSIGWYWSSTQFDNSAAFWLILYNSGCEMQIYAKSFGSSVRCIKCVNPATPAPGTHVPSINQIVWNWNPAAGATAYKWNTSNDYGSATDMGTATTKTETGLACGTSYSRFVWAYNSCGYSSPVSIQATTTSVDLATPTTSTHVPSINQIVWNWNPVAGATGYKWNTDNNYSTATDMGTATTKTETGLCCGTSFTRYVWAYNSCDNSTPVSLTQSTLSCPPCLTFTDSRDGKSYNTVQICNQCWMAQNLNVGTRINGSGDQTNNSAIEKYCYGDNESNCDTYGGLYQWNEAMQYSTTQGVQGICPTGWHLPSDDEWTTLTDYVNSQPSYQCNSTSGYIAKALAAKTLWNSSINTCAVGNDLSLNNATGFTGLPGGTRSGIGTFNSIGNYGFWWSSTEYSSSYAWGRSLSYENGYLSMSDYNRQYGFSVRCLRD